MNLKIYLYIKALTSVGILLAVYLLVEQIFHPAFQPCNVNSSVNCTAIISGIVSKTLGLPTPFYGLMGYIVILLSAIFHRKKILLATATFGLVFLLRIGYIELAILHVICPVCIGCQLIMIIVFTLALVLSKKTNK
jgi:uncharacterized membrane protein